MMEARELRIGNYYDFSHSGQIEQITGKDIYDFESDPIDDIYYPIPLTEEWLLKFGAHKERDKWIYDRFKLFYFESYDYWYVTDHIDNTYITKLNYVHEWQNLFFTLNRRELTLNETK